MARYIGTNVNIPVEGLYGTLNYLPHAIMGAGIWLATRTQPFPALTIGDVICFAILAWLLVPRRNAAAEQGTDQHFARWLGKTFKRVLRR